jgi:hypothetical protein
MVTRVKLSLSKEIQTPPVQTTQPATDGRPREFGESMFLHAVFTLKKIAAHSIQPHRQDLHMPMSRRCWLEDVHRVAVIFTGRSSWQIG